MADCSSVRWISINFDTQLLLFMLVIFSLDGCGLKGEGIWVHFLKYMYIQADGDSSRLGKRISHLWPAFLYISASLPCCRRSILEWCGALQKVFLALGSLSGVLTSINCIKGKKNPPQWQKGRQGLFNILTFHLFSPCKVLHRWCSWHPPVTAVVLLGFSLFCLHTHWTSLVSAGF